MTDDPVTCQPEQVTGYVDDALDPVARASVEAHLEKCPRCREQVAAERALRARLAALPAVELPPGLEARVRRRLRPSPARLGWLLPLAAVLALVVWARGTPPFVAWQLARDHVHCFSRPTLPAEVWSEDPDRVEAWERAHGVEPPLLPAVAGGMTLIGGRRCPLLDRRVGHVYYGREDRHLSLFVVPEPVRTASGQTYTFGGQRVRMLRVGGRNVGLVADSVEDLDRFQTVFSSTVARLEPTRQP